MDLELNIKLEDWRPVPLPLEQLRYLAMRSLDESNVEETNCTTGTKDLLPVPFDLKPVPSASLPEPEELIYKIATSRVQPVPGELEVKCISSPEELRLLHE